MLPYHNKFCPANKVCVSLKSVKYGCISVTENAIQILSAVRDAVLLDLFFYRCSSPPAYLSFGRGARDEIVRFARAYHSKDRRQSRI